MSLIVVAGLIGMAVILFLGLLGIGLCVAASQGPREVLRPTDVKPRSTAPASPK
jgi:hypothetical protein